jgi:hypothetical protein
MVRPCEAQAIVRFLANNSGIEIPSAPPITKWARLRLPNGQVARSAWKENAMTKQPRMARNVKVCLLHLHSSANLFFTVTPRWTDSNRRSILLLQHDYTIVAGPSPWSWYTAIHIKIFFIVPFTPYSHVTTAGTIHCD